MNRFKYWLTAGLGLFFFVAGFVPVYSQRPDQSLVAQESAQERVDTIRADVDARRAEIKQTVCERKQDRLSAVIPRLATGVKSVKGAFDTVYERVQSFYDSGQLTVENYDELKTAVDAAQAQAMAAIEAVDSFVFVLDCDNPNVADQLSGYTASISEARDALKDYKNALVDLISALRAEAETQEGAGTGDEDEN